jgi:hypothetical protein
MPKDEEKGLTKRARERRKMEEAARKLKENQQKIEEAATIKNTKVREGKHSLAGTRFLKGEDVRSFKPVRKPKPAPKPETKEEKERRGYIPSSGTSAGSRGSKRKAPHTASLMSRYNRWQKQNPGKSMTYNSWYWTTGPGKGK